MGQPLTRESRKQAELRDVRDKYHAQYQKLTADMQAEIREIERRYAFEEAA